MSVGRMFSMSDRGDALRLWPFARQDYDSVGGGGYQGGARSPVGIGAAIAVHILVAGVVLLVPKTVYTPYLPPSFNGTNIPIEPDPPEVVQEIEPEVKTKPTARDPFVPERETVVPDGTGATITRGERTIGDGSGTGQATITEPTAILPDPVLVEARIDPRHVNGFQPDYPGAMIRLSEEGKVVVRVTIGPDGRVIDIAQVSATNDAFWLATQRHALRRWRFVPATRDGVAVSTVKTLTVHFRLAD